MLTLAILAAGLLIPALALPTPLSDLARREDMVRCPPSYDGDTRYAECPADWQSRGLDPAKAFWPSAPLYGSSGRPHPDDVGQNSEADCGFCATLVALAHHNASWIEALLRTSNGHENSTSVDAMVYQLQRRPPPDDAGFTGPVAVSNVQQEVAGKGYMTNQNNAGAPWWPGALYHAVTGSGTPTDRGTTSLGGGLGMRNVPTDNSLRWLTGLEIHYEVPAGYEWYGDFPGKFELLSKGGLTPMLVATSKRVELLDTMRGHHAYAVYGAHVDANGTRVLTLRNPWYPPAQPYDYDKVKDIIGPPAYPANWETGPVDSITNYPELGKSANVTARRGPPGPGAVGS